MQEAELAMLERLPLIGALDAPSLTEKKSLERSARLQELLYFCVNEDLRPSGRLMAFTNMTAVVIIMRYEQTLLLL